MPFLVEEAEDESGNWIYTFGLIFMWKQIDVGLWWAKNELQLLV